MGYYKKCNTNFETPCTSVAAREVANKSTRFGALRLLRAVRPGRRSILDLRFIWFTDASMQVYLLDGSLNTHLKQTDSGRGRRKSRDPLEHRLKLKL